MIEPDPESMAVQQGTVLRMKEIGINEFCCRCPHTGQPLTYGEFYDRHARLMLVIWEAEQRLGPCKMV